MFMDMVGYTALGQKNEALSLALVDEQRKLIRPILARHSGTEIKTIGDAFLVEFPSALDAVRCAYDIQRAIREFNYSLPDDRRVHLRIGVHLGDVVVESGGDISGDAVNIASRIVSLAVDGGVCLTRQVYDHVQNKFELPLSNLGPKALKNVSTQLEVYRMMMPWEEGASVSAVQRAPERTRIAVLPFANMSPDPSDEYFADGMTEELITSLSGIKQLTVIARTSVMKYKVSTKGASEIGKELNVGTLVEGSVRKAANRVRITVQLIDALNEGHVWAQNYDRQLDDIFAIQSEIAQRVAQELEVQLLAQEKGRLERKPTASTEAYTLYLKGRHFWNERTKEATSKAVRCFEGAVGLDPRFAPAYSGLADCYVTSSDYGWLNPSDALPKAKSYATRAVETDPTLAEGHSSLGAVLDYLDWNWTEAEKEFKRAIELRPSYASAYQWNAILLQFMERHEEAFENISRAKELDPLSRVIGMNYGLAMLSLGRVEEAIDQLKEVIELNPDYSQVHLFLGMTYSLTSRSEEAIREVEAAVKLSGGDPETMTQLCFIFGRNGRTDQASKILEELQKVEKDTHVSNVWMATAFWGAGRSDEAFERLESALRERSSQLFYFKSFPWLQAFRSDPRWAPIEERMRRVIA